MTRSLIAAVILGTALIVPAATASDYYDDDVQTTVVSVADLDLSTGWGMDRLIKRLRGRIDDMCGWDEDCRDGAWLSADWQVARAVSRDQWRHRIAEEREADRRYYRMRRFAPPPPPRPVPVPVAPPRIAYLPIPAPPARLVSKTTKVTTTVIRTTEITLTYRTPPASFRPAWKPRCACVE
ncbi:MAG: UrcA family protein [Sphingomonas sp.]|uniref:UrcA family protein n=1 Tax=Sphingomonas sp. TaxID=28214 RepID=UPI003F81AE3C